MKKNLKMAVALAALTIMVGAATAVMAQPRVGGYKVIPNTDTEAKKAAVFAIGDQNSHSYSSFQLQEILKVERQIVAGSNYRICMNADDLGSNENSGTYQAVVYVDLKNVRKLVSWAKSDCGSAAPVKPPIVGGYKPVETTDEHARAAAEWAVREKGEKTGKAIELLTLVKAAQQVVQGMNYRFCMKINTEDEDEPVSFVEAIVYMDLKMNYKLSGWKTVAGCEE